MSKDSSLSGLEERSRSCSRNLLVVVLVVYSVLMLALLGVEDPNLLYRYWGVGAELSTAARLVLLSVLVGGAWLVFIITGAVAQARVRREKRRILTIGTKAEALVQRVDDLHVDYMDGLELLLRVHVQVMPEEESPFEASIVEKFSRVSLPRKGDRLWVFYDPADHRKVVVAQVL